MVELYQPMSQLMQDIQGAVIECMDATLGELKRSCVDVSSAIMPGVRLSVKRLTRLKRTGRLGGFHDRQCAV